MRSGESTFNHAIIRHANQHAQRAEMLDWRVIV